MSALPRFFLLSLVAGLALWATNAPPPFALLAKLIAAASALGVIVSTAYVQAFMPWQWRSMRAALRRAWRSVCARSLPAD